MTELQRFHSTQTEVGSWKPYILFDFLEGMYENTFPGKVHASIIFWSRLFFITFMWLHKSPRNSFITLGCNNLYENLGAQMAWYDYTASIPFWILQN